MTTVLNLNLARGRRCMSVFDVDQALGLENVTNQMLDCDHHRSSRLAGADHQQEFEL